MIDNSKYNNEFTAQDIERYYSGKMSSLEMHQLEKAAMEDPFLADALEGYSYTQTPAEDKAYLQTELQSKMSGAKVVPVRSFNKNQFLRMVALFILLAGCGWAVYQFGFNTKKNDLAIVKNPEISTPPTPGLNSSPITSDTNNNDAALQQSTATTETNRQTKTMQSNGRGTVTLSAQNRHEGKLNAANTVDKEQAQNFNLAQAESGSVTKDNRDAAASLKEESFAKTKKKITEGDTSFIASAPQTVTPGKENVIVLQRSKTDPIPEVVLGKSMKDSNYRKPHITFEEAEPEKGSAYFDDYVAQNLQLPEEEKQKNISGEVKLSFDVNDAGQAVNIAVEKSLCTECDKEAIRLLQEGPKWIKKKRGKKGKLSIKF